MDHFTQQITQFINEVPQDVWSCLVTAVLSIAAIWTHSRGWRMPLLENLLDRLISDPKKKEALDLKPTEIVPGKSNAEVFDVLYAIATKDMKPDDPLKRLLDALVAAHKGQEA